MPGIPFFDSKECEWSDLSIAVSGSRATKFTGLKYGVKVSKEHLFAAGDDPHSIQSGNREPTGTLTLLKNHFDAMNIAAKAAGGRDLTDVVWTITAKYKAKDLRPIQIDVLEGVEITGFEKGMMQNAKSMPIDLPFLFLRLNGVNG